jgi:hypothetical protein
LYRGATDVADMHVHCYDGSTSAFHAMYYKKCSHCM